MSYTPKVWKFSGEKREDARRWKEEFVCEMEAAGQPKYVHFSSCLTGRAYDWYCKEVPYDAKLDWGQLSKLFTARWIEPLPTSTLRKQTASANQSSSPKTTPVLSVSAADTKMSTNDDIPEYDVFMVAARELQGAQKKYPALVALWKKAYELGKQAERVEDEIQELTGEAWQEGYDYGTDTGMKDGYEKGYSEGVSKTEEVFVGHVSVGECSVGRKPRVDASVSTDPVPTPRSPIIPLASKPKSDRVAITQSEPPTTTSPKWAEDPDLLPVTQIPVSKSPRDLSVLRTPDVKNPFSSLRKRPKYDSHRPCHSQAPYLRPSQNPAPKSHDARQQYQTSRPSGTHLDWCHDPRLSRLARALQDLGWVFPMKFR